MVARCAQLQALLRDEVTGECSAVSVTVEAPLPSGGVHPAVLAAEEALAAAGADRTSAWLRRGPTVDATGTAAHYVAGDADGFGWSAGLQATLPLVSGGAGIGDIRSATASRDDAALALEGQRLELAAALVSAEASYEAAVATREALIEAEAAADEALQLVDARYREGLDGMEAWLAARRARDEAAVATARGRGAELSALAELESVRGVDGQ